MKSAPVSLKAGAPLVASTKMKYEHLVVPMRPSIVVKVTAGSPVAANVVRAVSQ